MNKKVCVIGTGRWGKNHVRTLHELGVLGGIVESDSSRLETFRTQYPVIKLFTKINDALQEGFDGFTVATPVETHYKIAKYLIEHKKHVLVEKPISLHVSEAKELKVLAEENHVNLMVGHVLLFHPAIRKINDLINDGKIGKLQYIYSNRLNLGAVRTEENILWSFAPHDISIFQYLIGYLPTEIVSRGGAFLQTHIHDMTMTILTYPKNVVCHIFVSWLHPFKEHRLMVIGSKGMLSFEDSSKNKELLFYEKGIDWIRGEPIKRDGQTEAIPYDKQLPLTEELRYFVNHLDGTTVEISNGQNAVDVLEILEKATESLQGGTKVQVSPTTDKDYFIHQSSVVDENVEIGYGTKIWHFSHVQSGAKIGENCSIGQNVNIANNVKIGNNVKIQNNVSVYEGVELEDYVFCGPSMVFTNINRPRSEFPQRGSEFYVKTLVKKSASIGANATILCGITIGEYAFIGAGAVLTKDVPAHSLVVGNPGKVIGWVDKKGNRLVFDNNGISECSRYRIKSGILIELISK